MNRTKKALLTASLALTTILNGQEVAPETERQFGDFVVSAQTRMNSRTTFLLADADPGLKERLARKQIETISGIPENPQKITHGQVYDWIGIMFVPGISLDRLIQMLKDYDHRAEYFPQLLSSAKLLCHTGETHFRFTMRLKDPAAMDVESDVLWERVDPLRWRCRSYSTNIREIGKSHGYLLRLYSYWRFAEMDKGVYVQGENITLSREFGGLTRALGSMIGLSPEKSLRHTLQSMREAVLNREFRFSSPPANMMACGAPSGP